MSNGTLWGWGADDYGQLGQGSTASARCTPVQIGSSTWKFIASGTYHSLGIRSDNTLWGWGFDNKGQLGQGSTANVRSTPVQIGSSTWKFISGGEYHSIGIRSDDTLWGWGYDRYGQLGQGSTTDVRSTPVQIGSSTWKVTATGVTYSLGIRSDDTLWGWGDDYYGQLGQGSTAIARCTPVQIGSSIWKFISVGSYHSLGILNIGVSIPIASKEDLKAIESTALHTFAEGTAWEITTTGGMEKSYTLMNDINLGGAFEPIGYGGTDFTGSFDGHGFKIYNGVINYPAVSGIGLFAYAYGGIIENLRVDNIVTGKNDTGGILGYGLSTIIRKCYNTGNITGDHWVGGIVGYSDESSITISYNTGNITGVRNQGGITGFLSSSSTTSSIVTNCYNTGNVNGEYYAGGIVGWVADYSTITNCYNNGLITISDSDEWGGVGGITGDEIAGGGIHTLISNSYHTGPDNGYGTLKTTTDLKSLSTFSAWDIAFQTSVYQDDYGWNLNYIWGIGSVNNGYPFLRLTNVPTIVPPGNIWIKKDGQWYTLYKR